MVFWVFTVQLLGCSGMFLSSCKDVLDGWHAVAIMIRVVLIVAVFFWVVARVLLCSCLGVLSG